MTKLKTPHITAHLERGGTPMSLPTDIPALETPAGEKAESLTNERRLMLQHWHAMQERKRADPAAFAQHKAEVLARTPPFPHFIRDSNDERVCDISLEDDCTRCSMRADPLCPRNIPIP
jgi:hypothetical protein